MSKLTQPAFTKNFKNLIVWKKSMEVVKDIYTIIKRFPDLERYALTSQIIRSATSISLNLAEGNSQLFVRKEINFFNNALGSCAETICALDIALQNKYITVEEHDRLEVKLIEIQKMTISYIRKLQKDINTDEG
jgi:S23 ribosomal protein.